MPLPQSLQHAAANAVQANALLQDPAVLRSGARPQLRPYFTSTLLPNGNIAETRHIAPALPLFENAFCAFSRGSLVETAQGPVAVEDLLPGDEIAIGGGGSQPLIWTGRTSLVPARRDARGRSHRLIRIMADSFGIHKPMSCVVAGPAARILRTPPHLRELAGGNPLLTPAGEFSDGISIFETAPPAPVDMFHLCLPQHAVINVGGLEFETYHPGPEALKLVSRPVKALYLNLFPHIGAPQDFGPLAHPRADAPGQAPAGVI
ncbi:Hint domain-containing protein [Roseobacteraceae bacterium NS-SX3]